MPAPIERSQLRGHRQQIGKSAALTVGRSPALSQRCGRCGSERSAEFGSVNRFRCPHATSPFTSTGNTRRRLPYQRNDPVLLGHGFWIFHVPKLARGLQRRTAANSRDRLPELHPFIAFPLLACAKRYCAASLTRLSAASSRTFLRRLICSRSRAAGVWRLFRAWRSRLSYS